MKDFLINCDKIICHDRVDYNGQLVHKKQFWGHLSKQDSVGQSGFLQACDGAAWIKEM